MKAIGSGILIICLIILTSQNALASKPTRPVSISLSIIGTPNLNQTVDLIATVKVTHGQAKNRTINITLPEGIELVSGNTSWTGYMSGNETKEIRVKIKAVKPGNWTIKGRSTSYTLGIEGETITFTNIIILNDTNGTSDVTLTTISSQNGNNVNQSDNRLLILIPLLVLVGVLVYFVIRCRKRVI